MYGAIAPRTLVAVAAILAVLATLSALSYAPVHAQESRERGSVLAAADSGPYTITLMGLPDVPTISQFNFTVTIESIERNELLEGLDVEVVAYTPTGEPEWRSPALSFGANPTSHVGNAPRPPKPAFSEPGAWTLEVRVDGPDGPASLAVPIEVEGRAHSGGRGAGLLFAFAFAGIVGVAVVLTYRIRRMQQRRSERSGR
jgi:hypothetical protein